MKLDVNSTLDENFKEYECDGTKFYLDSSTVQLGYSGVKGAEDYKEIVFDADKEEAFVKMKKWSCDDISEYGSIASIRKKGELARCWFCDGNNSFMFLRRGETIINEPSPDMINPVGNSVAFEKTVFKSQNEIEFVVTESTKNRVTNYQVTFKNGDKLPFTFGT